MSSRTSDSSTARRSSPTRPTATRRFTVTDILIASGDVEAAHVPGDDRQGDRRLPEELPGLQLSPSRSRSNRSSSSSRSPSSSRSSGLPVLPSIPSQVGQQAAARGVHASAGAAGAVDVRGPRGGRGEGTPVREVAGAAGGAARAASRSIRTDGGGGGGGGDGGGGGPPILKSLLVIPGDVAFLNQFFSLTILAQNGAPAGSNLRLREPHGEGLAASFAPRGRDEPADEPLRPGPDRGPGSRRAAGHGRRRHLPPGPVRGQGGVPGRGAALRAAGTCRST